MNNLEKLITNLSNYWDISPEQVVDRLNFMNEQEINKIVDKMTKKFKNGGFIDCLRSGGKTYTECKKCGGNLIRKGVTADWKRSNAVIDSLGVKAGVKKAQDGAALTRRDVINTLRNKGFSRSQAKREYQTQKNALRNNGFSGDEMRQIVRRNIVGQPTTVSRLIPASQASINTGVPQTYSPVAMSTRQEDNYMRLMTQRARAMANAEAATNFGDAFNIARSAGLQTFRWNGRDFNTRTRDEQNLIDSVLTKITPQSKELILPDVPAYKPYLPDVVELVPENIEKEESLPSANLNNSRGAYVESQMGRY